MKTIAKLGLAVALVVGLVAGANAGDPTTMTGNIMCAKCMIKKADAKECQDVLVVKDGDKAAEYYVGKNEVAKAFGHVCSHPKTPALSSIAWIAPSFEGRMQVAVVGIEKSESRMEYSRGNLELLAEVADQIGTLVSLSNSQPRPTESSNSTARTAMSSCRRISSMTSPKPRSKAG